MKTQIKDIVIGIFAVIGFTAVVNDIEEDNKVYKLTLAQAIPTVLAFNMRTQELGMKPQIFR